MKHLDAVAGKGNVVSVAVIAPFAQIEKKNRGIGGEVLVDILKRRVFGPKPGDVILPGDLAGDVFQRRDAFIFFHEILGCGEEKIEGTDTEKKGNYFLLDGFGSTLIVGVLDEINSVFQPMDGDDHQGGDGGEKISDSKDGAEKCKEKEKHGKGKQRLFFYGLGVYGEGTG